MTDKIFEAPTEFDWHQSVKQAQEVTHHLIENKKYPRIPYGDEMDDWGASHGPCGDCGVIKGQFHAVGCDVERCPKCQGQSITCECGDDEAVEGNFDLQAHSDKAVAAYLAKRGHFDQLYSVARNILQEAISRQGIKISSIDARSKDPSSFGRKASKPNKSNPSIPQYQDPLTDVTDLAGVRVITFFPSTIAEIDKIISTEFEILERSDKGEKLVDEERFGYQSIHYLVSISNARASLPEYGKFSGLIVEIQVRTILQHAWAEIEHDIQYKSASVIPVEISRRFTALAGMLEIADREFQAVQDEDQRLRQAARQMIKSGEIDEVEITPDALKAFLTKRVGGDQRISWFSYDLLARSLRKFGFRTLRQLDNCTRGYDDDLLCRLVYKARQGQIIRFELMLMAGMGEVYAKRHPWSGQEWFIAMCGDVLKILGQNKIDLRSFDPLATPG